MKNTSDDGRRLNTIIKTHFHPWAQRKTLHIGRNGAVNVAVPIQHRGHHARLHHLMRALLQAHIERRKFLIIRNILRRKPLHIGVYVVGRVSVRVKMQRPFRQKRPVIRVTREHGLFVLCSHGEEVVAQWPKNDMQKLPMNRGMSGGNALRGRDSRAEHARLRAIRKLAMPSWLIIMVVIVFSDFCGRSGCHEGIVFVGEGASNFRKKSVECQRWVMPKFAEKLNLTRKSSGVSLP